MKTISRSQHYPLLQKIVLPLDNRKRKWPKKQETKGARNNQWNERNVCTFEIEPMYSTIKTTHVDQLYIIYCLHDNCKLDIRNTNSNNMVTVIANSRHQISNWPNTNTNHGDGFWLTELRDIRTIVIYPILGVFHSGITHERVHHQ